MSQTKKRRQSLWIRFIFAFLLLGGLSEPAEARLKDKIKDLLKKTREAQEIVDESASAAAKTMPPSRSGMRNVLLVSKPKHDVKVAKGSTLAFIDFNHIEERIYGDRDNQVCAAQVAAAIAQHLADLNEFQVATREHLGTVLNELKLSHSGSVNSASAAKLGELIGADVLIYGQVQLCVPGQHIANEEPAKAGDKTEDLLRNELQGTVNKNATGIVKGVANDLLGAFLGQRPRAVRERAYIQAQIQLIEAQTGKRVFTSSLRGEFLRTKGKGAREISDRELLAKAADDLADNFIDDFLERREPLYIGLYSGGSLDLDKGIDNGPQNLDHELSKPPGPTSEVSDGNEKPFEPPRGAGAAGPDRGRAA